MDGMNEYGAEKGDVPYHCYSHCFYTRGTPRAFIHTCMQSEAESCRITRFLTRMQSGGVALVGTVESYCVYVYMYM